jgi:hypothetical protein
VKKTRGQRHVRNGRIAVGRYDHLEFERKRVSKAAEVLPPIPSTKTEF